MKNKLRVGALLLTAVMLVSGICESAPIVVRAEEQTEIEQEALQTVSGGNVEEAATDGEKQENGGNESETETTDVLVAEVKDRKQVYEKEIAFDPSSDWSDQGEFEIGITTEEALHNGAYLTMDVLVPDNVKFSNCMKVQGIAKVGDEWTWTEAGNIPELTIDSFGEVVDGYRRATIRFDFGGNIENGAIKTTLIKLAGYQCDYKGNVYIENVRLYDKQTSGEQPAQPEKPPLPEKDPSIIDNFEDGICADWVNGSGWQYDNSITNTVVDYNGSKMMKVDLDYTGMGSYSWSEAKLENKFADGFDISAYNLLSFDYYYPAAMSGSKIKIFSNSGINCEAEITEIETLADGLIHARVQVKFSPSDQGLADLTIGFVGVNTEFKGSVYVDNITLSQYNATGDFVKITATPNAVGTQADVSNAPTQVKLSDANAGTSATALYAYLMALRAKDQVFVRT